MLCSFVFEKKHSLDILGLFSVVTKEEGSDRQGLQDHLEDHENNIR